MIEQMLSTSDMVIVGSTVVFVLVTIVFALVYHGRISYATKELNDSKDIISSIVLTFRRRQDEFDGNLSGVANDVDNLHVTANSLNEQNRRIEGMIESLITSVTSTFTINKKVVERIETMKEEIGNISKTQQSMQKQMTSIEEQRRPIEQTKADVSSEEKGASIEMTDTENEIIGFLLNHGPKTAPEVEKEIKKTREHTARLMKKLWQEGFIERDTHRIPFIYSANEGLKERLATKA